MKKALITGITGQDGAYLTKTLLDSGYKVIGGVRRGAERSFWRLKELGLEQEIEISEIELCEFSNVLKSFEKHKPDLIFNLAAQSFVGSSFDEPIYTIDVDALGVVRCLEAVRVVTPESKFYQASTSEMFGGVHNGIPTNEKTFFQPRSPYACGKLLAHHMVQNYRQGYGIFGCSGILFNHESPLRGEEFVTRKVTLGIANILSGKQDKISLGNIDSERDWGHAQDYVEAMKLMLEHDCPDDYVIATGETYKIRKFIELAFEVAGINIEWSGTGLDEKGINVKNGKVLIDINPKFFRPTEVDVLIGDPSKAEQVLNWRRKYTFEDLVVEMVESDIKKVHKN